jgi:hypothetical protein
MAGINYAAYGFLVDTGVGDVIDVHHYSDPAGRYRYSVL